MAAARSMKTTLAFGLVTCEVALYRAVGDPPKAKAWEWAGPNGGKLLPPEHTEAARGASIVVPPLPETRSDPLADDPASAFAEIMAVGEKDPGPDELYMIEGGTGEHVTMSERRRGFRGADGAFYDVTDGLEEIAERTKLEEMRVTDFIRVEEIRRERVLGSYFVAPSGAGAAKVIRLMHEAMRIEKRVAVVKFTKRTKQSLAVLVPHPATKSLMVIELAWAADCREAPLAVSGPAEVELVGSEVAVACELVQALSSTRAASLDAQVDDSRQMVADLIERAEEGKPYEVAARPEPMEDGADVISIMRGSLEDRDALAAAAA